MERPIGWIRATQIALALFSMLTLLFIAIRMQPHTFYIQSPLQEILAPHEHDDGDAVEDVGHGIVLNSYATTTEDMWVTDMKVSIRNAPFATLHHVTLSSVVGEDSECPGTPALKDYIAVGQDTPSDFSFPKPYGMFIKKGTVLQMATMLHNPEKEGEAGTTFHNVQVKIAITSARPGEREKDIQLLRIAVQDTPYCNKDPKGPGFTVPLNTDIFKKTPEETGKNRGRFTFNAPGVLLNGYGHLHGWDGGKEVSLFINDTLVNTWKTEAVAHPAEYEHVWNTPLVELALPVHIGDVASVEGVYTNPTNFPVRNAMAAVRLFFSPDP